MTHHTPDFTFDNSYARELDGFYVPWEGDKVPEPRIVLLNAELAEALNLDADALDSDEGAAILAAPAPPTAPRRWRRPMPGTSSVASRRGSAMGGRSFWAR